MTTVVCSKTNIASDSQCDDGGLRDEVQKVFSVKGHLIGIAGEYGQGLLFVEWFHDRRKSKPNLDDGFEALVVEPNGRIVKYESTLVPQPVKRDFYAIGSGRDYAMAAMYLGCDVKRAVEVACVFDTGSSTPVQVLEH